MNVSFNNFTISHVLYVCYLFSFLAISCTSDEPEIHVSADDKELVHTCYMYFDQEALSRFDTTRSGEEQGWHNGDVVYIKFLYSSASATEYVAGNAVYNSSMDLWQLTYNGYIPNEGICRMLFFDPSGDVSSMVVIDENTVVYEDMDATYKKNSKGDVIVHACLEPKTGRVRFEGESNTEILVGGLTILSYYDVVNDRFTAAPKYLSLKVGSGGFTPYVYATSDVKDLRVELDYIRYTKTFSGILYAGKSGVIKIPYPWDYAGWIRFPLFETVTVKGVTFKMMYVDSGTFLMGATEEQENPKAYEFPVHQVTLTNDYYMGETVVTQALWEAVMGNNPSSSVGDNRPVTNVSWSDCQLFITKLNELTGKTFRLPTEAEWEYAARGGYRAAGHQYSGGSNIGDYAWYGGGILPDVKTKLPNVLGLYDMSGCVWEWCGDCYSDYSDAPVTDPNLVRSSDDDRMNLRGGCYESTAEYCRTATRAYISSGSTCGFRLAF